MSRSRSRSPSPRRQISRLLRRHRPMVLTVFVAVVAVLGAMLLFTKIRAG